MSQLYQTGAMGSLLPKPASVTSYVNTTITDSHLLELLTSQLHSEAEIVINIIILAFDDSTGSYITIATSGFSTIFPFTGSTFRKHLITNDG